LPCSERFQRLGFRPGLTAARGAGESPWREINGGKALDSGRLARELARYHVRPGPVWIGGKTVKGYVTHETSNQVGLADAWSRYLPADNETGEA
jgi:hypothetical protein